MKIEAAADCRVLMRVVTVAGHETPLLTVDALQVITLESEARFPDQAMEMTGLACRLCGERGLTVGVLSPVVVLSCPKCEQPVYAIPVAPDWLSTDRNPS